MYEQKAARKLKRERRFEIKIGLVLLWLFLEDVLPLMCNPVAEQVIKHRCAPIFGFSLTSGSEDPILPFATQLTSDPLFILVYGAVAYGIVSLVFVLIDLFNNARQNNH